MKKIIKLNNKSSLEISPIAPYNFDATVFKPSHYPDSLKIYEKGKYWFALKLNDRIYGIKLKDKGTINHPKIKIDIFSNLKLSQEEINNIINELNFRFEFNKDISDFFKKFKNDKILSRFIKKWYGMHSSCSQDLYGLMMISIFLQNTIIKRTVQMTNAMLEKYGTKVRFDKKEVYSFWNPKDMIKVSEEGLRKLKVGYRAKFIKKFSETLVNEKINEYELRNLPLEDIKERLLKLYGVGPETARILLHEVFHDYTLFEHVSPWQQKIYSMLLFKKKLVSPEKIIKYINVNWDGWAALASHYIWEDIFWRRKHGENIEWLEKEIRL